MRPEVGSGLAGERGGRGRIGLIRALLIAATAVDILVSMGLWSALSGEQAMWPLPGAYFVEAALLPATAAAAALTRPGVAGDVAMAAAGAAWAFCALGILGVGAAYVVGAALLLAAGLFAGPRGTRSGWGRPALFLVGVTGQAALMVGLVLVSGERG